MSEEKTMGMSGADQRTSNVLDYDRSVLTQNDRGEWVPSIPLPFYGLRKRCSCGRKFWTTEGYEGHYAAQHVLGIRGVRA